MKRIVTALVVGLLVGSGVELTWVGAQGPLTNAMNLRVRSDSAGSLMVTSAVVTGATGPLTPFGNIRLKTDSNGYLIVAMNGGDGSVPTGVATGSMLASNGVGAQGVWSASPTLTSLNVGTINAPGTPTQLNFQTNSVTRWFVDQQNALGTGHFLPNASNTYDIGGAGYLVRTGYFGTSLVVGTNLTLSAAVPTITSGFGTTPSIVGTDTGFRITLGTPVGQTGVVAFNTTFANPPAVHCGDETSIAGDPIKETPTATNVTLTFTLAVAADKISCIVAGF